MNQLYCSFCFKASNDVKGIVAGPAVYICDECVILCTKVLVEEGKLDWKYLEKKVLEEDEDDDE